MPVRPMRVGEMLDAAINLYRANWKTFMAIVAFVTVPFVFLHELFLILASRGADVGLGGEIPDSGAQAGFLVVTVAFAALEFLLVRPFLTAAMVRAVAATYLGEAPSVGLVYGFALERLGSILWVLLLTILGIFAVVVAAVGFSALFLAVGAAPLVALVVIGAAVLSVILYVRWTFGPSVVVVEGGRGRAALARSWQLSSKAFWKVAGTTFLAGLLTALVGGVLAIVPALLSVPLGSGGWLLRAAGSSLASVVTTPFATMIAVLLYFDQRIRKEGLDIAIMAGEMRAASGS